VTKRLIDYDPLSRTGVYHSYDDQTKETVIEEIQDVSHFLEVNRNTQNHDVGGGGGLNEYSRKGIKNGWWHVAKKLLNDPEWRYLRTGTGRV
jgi:hypothetical protein